MATTFIPAPVVAPSPLTNLDSSAPSLWDPTGLQLWSCARTWDRVLHAYLTVTRHLAPADELRVTAQTIERAFGPAAAQAALLRYMVATVRNLQRHNQYPTIPAAALDGQTDTPTRLLFQAIMAQAAGAQGAVEDHIQLLNQLGPDTAGQAILACLAHLAQRLTQLGPQAARRLPQLPATEPAAALQAATTSLPAALDLTHLYSQYGPLASHIIETTVTGRRVILENTAAALAILLVPQIHLPAAEPHRAAARRARRRYGAVAARAWAATRAANSCEQHDTNNLLEQLDTLSGMAPPMLQQRAANLKRYATTSTIWN